MQSKNPIQDMVQSLTTERSHRENVACIHRLESVEPTFSDFPVTLNYRLIEAMKSRGINQLYSHQTEAIESVLDGENIVIVTPTASGKTLCYNLPVLNEILKNPESRAIYLFPTKALSQDQLDEVHGIISDLEEDIKTFTYDGDTPEDARRAIRSVGHIVISNPDMLHTGILPHHTKWVKLFENLKYVILDEMHYYRGVFGSHVANLFRRLKRVAAFYNSKPQFILCSATIANPKELAEKLLEEKVTLIDKNGAPQGEKFFLFYNPPVVNKELGIRANYINTARKLSERFISNGISTIIFATSRLNVEILTRYLKESFDTGIAEKGRIRGYRGGYLPLVRREIEKGMRDGEIKGIVSTNALELGIDIGSLEACIIAGYPGSIASAWQQAGRAGRKSGLSVVILVGRSTPLDQFIMNNPDFFFKGSPENARINPDNLLILLSHIKCAAFELPFTEGESFGGENLEEMLSYLEEHGVLHKVSNKWHWTQDSYPANGISLRSVSSDNFVVVDITDDNRIIAHVDFSAAPSTIHNHAIYLCEGKQFFVENLDFAARKAFVKEENTDYYTDAMEYTKVRILDEFDTRSARNATVEYGEVHVTSRVVGFKKIKFGTNENVGFGDITLPENEMHTTSYWFTVAQQMLDIISYNRSEIIDGLTGVSYLLHNLASVILMCDIRDIERCIGDKSTEWFARQDRSGTGAYSWKEKMQKVDLTTVENFEPTIFIYDNYPGGIGFSELLFQRHEELLGQAFTRLNSCSCEFGCPSCVGPINEVGRNAKEVAVEILKRLIDDKAQILLH